MGQITRHTLVTPHEYTPFKPGKFHYKNRLFQGSSATLLIKCKKSCFLENTFINFELGNK
jgi:hypothetical protein